MERRVIRKGDTTTHGGVVLEGLTHYTILDIEVACKGHLVFCPLCKGIYPIVEGVYTMPIDTVYFPSIEGMKTACGASLIASQNFVGIDQ